MIAQKQFYQDKDAQGRLIAEGWYRNGLEDSLWKFYENGMLQEESWYWNGKLHGPSKKYYPNGQLQIEAYFFLDKQDSVELQYNDKGVLMTKGSYQNGRRVGVHCILSEGKDTLRKEEYRQDTLYLWKSCKWLMEEGIRHLKCDVINGNGIEERYENGKLRETTAYKNGLPEGKYGEYFTNGRGKVVGEYVKGRKIGRWSSYYVNGKLKRVVHYDRDLLTGSVEEYSDKGQLLVQGNHWENRKTGHWKWYREDGILEMEGDFVEDLQSGEWRYYQNNGNLASFGKYDEESVPEIGNIFIPKSKSISQGAINSIKSRVFGLLGLRMVKCCSKVITAMI